MTIKSTTSVLTLVNDVSTHFEHLGGAFNLKISGTFTGTVEIQRAFTSGSNLPQPEDWQAVTNTLSGTVVEITTELNQPVYDPEEGVWYRAVLTAISSGGPITVRMSQ